MSRLLIVVAVIAALAVPAAAQGAVKVVQTDEEGNQTTLVSFKSAKCRKTTRKKASLKFTASAKKSGYRLSVDVFQFGLDVDLAYGGPNQFTVAGPEGRFSNLNVPPDAPPGGGGVRFNNRKKTRMGLGFSPAFNESLSGSVSVAGGLNCKYPKKKKRPRR